MLLTPVQYAVVDFLNLVFGDTKEAKTFWKEVKILFLHLCAPRLMRAYHSLSHTCAFVAFNFIYFFNYLAVAGVDRISKQRVSNELDRS